MRKIFVGIVVIAALVVSSSPATGYRGAPGFLPGIVYDENFPDPHVIEVDGIYFAYATNTGGPKIPTLWSVDLETWFTHGAWGPEVSDSSQFGNDSLVQAPSWAARTSSGNEVWAPAVVQLSTGWRAYFTIRESNGSRPRYCISVASGPGPLGPFRDTSTEPLTCGYGPAGAIDPWVYVDQSGTPWLLWKVEPFAETELEDDDTHFPSDEDFKERPPHEPPRVVAASGTAIWAQELNSAGTWFAEDSEANVLLKAKGSSSWERSIIENPAMFAMDGRLHLLYSGNRWGSPDYATGWAVCNSPAGPCNRASSTPILATNATENGPGGASVFVDTHGEHQVAYHAWNAPFSSYPSFPACDTDGNRVCKDEGQRYLHVDVLCRIPGGVLTVGLPGGWDFCDTDAGSWRGPGVSWLNEHNITTGISPNYFAPDRTITRAEAVTLLWRWAGKPASPGPTAFVDLKENAFYVAAVEWAAQIGIVAGTNPTTFSPEEPITRGQVATILYRAAGSVAPESDSSFDDVPADAFYNTPVAWLTAESITTGLTSTTFGPVDPSTRAQFATMLCRMSRSELNETALFVPTIPSCDDGQDG